MIDPPENHTQLYVDSESLLFKDSHRFVVSLCCAWQPPSSLIEALRWRGESVPFGVSAWLIKTLYNIYCTRWYVSVLCGTTRLWNPNPKQQQPCKVGHVPVEVLLWGMLEVVYLCFTWCWHVPLFLMDWFQTTIRDTEYSQSLCQLKHLLQLLWFWIFSAIKYKLCLLQVIF